MSTLKFARNTAQWLLFLNAFVIEAVFRQRAFAEKTVDFQVAIKLVLWALVLIFCVGLYRLWARKLARIDNAFQVFLLLDIFISCSYAPNPTYSLGCAFSLLAVLLLLLTASSVLTNREMLQPIIHGCTLVAAISIAVYYLDPELGRMKEWVGAAHVPGKRLAGITGSANTMGYISALCLLTLYYYRAFVPRRLAVIHWIYVALNLTALYMSNSRTSMAALALGIGAASLLRPTPARLAALFLGICAAIVCLLSIDTADLFGALARSGDASEIESGTGRTAIWHVAVNLIAQKPFLGWGYSASTYLLPEHAGDIGFLVNQAHNAFLQVALSTGLVGTLLFTLLLLIKLGYSIRSGQQINLAMMVFLLIDGVSEPIAFSGVATTTTLALALVLALNYREAPRAALQPSADPKHTPTYAHT